MIEPVTDEPRLTKLRSGLCTHNPLPLHKLESQASKPSRYTTIVSDPNAARAAAESVMCMARRSAGEVLQGLGSRLCVHNPVIVGNTKSVLSGLSKYHQVVGND